MNPGLKNVSICSQQENCQISLKIVSIRSQISSQFGLKLVSKFETILRHGSDYPIILSQLRITRLAAPRHPGGLVPPSRRTSQVAIVLAPAVVTELQKCCLERDFPHKMKAFKACEFIHS